MALEARKSPLAIWKEHFVGLWLTYLGATFASMLMLVLSHDWSGQPMQPLEVLLLIAPLPVILYVTFMHAVGRAHDQIEHLGGMNRVYVATIEALAQTIDAKDQVTHDHIRRVQENSVRLAHALGVTDDGEIQALKAASLLHDVGKISVPEHILNKPGRLTPAELEIMQRHAPVGADILSVIGFPYPVVPTVRHHHENWDGTGYPDGLAGEAIPIGARILMVVDCFDALTSDRPYRPRFETAAALQVLVDWRGTMYRPAGGGRLPRTAGRRAQRGAAGVGSRAGRRSPRDARRRNAGRTGLGPARPRRVLQPRPRAGHAGHLGPGKSARPSGRRSAASSVRRRACCSCTTRARMRWPRCSAVAPTRWLRTLVSRSASG